MIHFRKSIKKILVNGVNLDFNNAVIILQESNGWKTWTVDVDGAELALSIIINKGSVQLKMTCEDLTELQGEAFVKNRGCFNGTGVLSS